MKDGKIVQEGPPGEIYHNPVSRFVAEFFGISAMNLIEGKLIEEDKGTVFSGAGLTVRLPEYGRFTNTQVTLGVRPESVLIGNLEGQAEDGSGTVNSLELLGDENHVSISLEQEQKITAITSPKVKPRLDERVKVKLKEDQIFLFDRQQGGRLHL